MRKKILCDIDGVLARQNYPALHQRYNEMLELAIPEEQLVGISRDAFHELAPVQAYRARVGEKRYHWQMEAIQWQASYILSLLTNDGALMGVRYLAEVADEFEYCTARYISVDAKWNKFLAASTKLWLKLQGFPVYEQVHFCDGIKAKLECIVKLLRNALEETHIWLVDDCAQQLVDGFLELEPKDQEILSQHLTLVAFGYDAIGEHEYQLSIVPLSDWQEVTQVEKEFI